MAQDVQCYPGPAGTWDVGIKDVHSGRNKATADQIRLCEALHEERLQRQAGDFLCRSASGINGKQWSSRDAERAVDGDGNECVPPVTCPQCLALARRWVRKEAR